MGHVTVRLLRSATPCHPSTPASSSSSKGRSLCDIAPSILASWLFWSLEVFCRWTQLVRRDVCDRPVQKLAVHTSSYPLTLFLPSLYHGVFWFLVSITCRLTLTVPYTSHFGQSWGCVIFFTLQKELSWPKWRATSVYICIHKYLESDLTAFICSKIRVVLFPWSYDLLLHLCLTGLQ